MKVNEIEFNGAVYRITPTKDEDCCKNCALQVHCDNCTQDGDFIYNICQEYTVKTNFQRINKRNIKRDTKFYRFSTGAVFNISHINRIITIGEIKSYEGGDYSFVVSTTDWTASITNKSKLTLSRERNRFIKFIEEYGN